MADEVIHKHLIVRALVNNPIKDQQEAEDFIKFIVNEIDMKLVAGPISAYVTKEGNKGITCTCLIETSNIVFHIWDEPSPALLQFDLYSCADFSIYHILTLIDDKMDLVQYDHLLLDRGCSLTVKE